MPIPAEVYREVHLSPSILSADFSRLGEQISLVMDVGVRMIHFDVMDGHFVPNLSIGPGVLKSVAPLVHGRGGLFSVHLMLAQPEKYVADFIHAGADAVSFHVESGVHHRQTIATIKRLGAGAGVALNPGTDLTRVAELLPLVDFVLVMTVNPGFGGQKHIPAALNKLPRLREVLPPEAAIEVDGGIDRHNIQHAVQAGANWVVAGSAVFGAADPAAEALTLQERARAAQMYG
ncbi:MAG: ribulose-phosphate 3-epimerase [Thermoleophilia bacterium]|jgi:ribulose-phosphate 3-epimerase